MVVAALAIMLIGGMLPTYAQAPSDYLLGPGDVLNIVVLGDADLTRTVTVRPDGKITFPLLGDLLVAGLTPTQTADLVASGLRKYVRNPVVSVTVAQMRVERAFVYLVGAGVARPGPYEIQPGWTVIEAMAAGGGVLPRAALKRASLIRKGSPQPTPLDLERLLLQADQSANVVLQSGDIIMVPLQDMRVAVLGIVRNPGAYELGDGARLLDAVVAAGGPADRAALETVGVIRQGPDGKLTVKTYDLTKVLESADGTQNPILQHADVVFVPQDNRIRWQDILPWLSGFIRTLF